MKLNLLCTFIQKSDLDIAIDWIKDHYTLKNNSIFVFENEDRPSQLYCTFNVHGKYDLIKNTILLHRKSDTNTLYTINAINQLIKRINNGILDTSYQIEWENYSDSIILTQNDNVVIYPISLNKIVHI